MAEPIQFRDLHTANARFIELVYHELLEPSFGPDELDPLEVVLDGLAKDGSFELWGRCAMDGDMPVGCILGYPYRESGVLLIGYLVVRDGMRGRGIGGSLADEVRRRWYGEPGLPLFWRKSKIRATTPLWVISTPGSGWPSTHGVGRRSSPAPISSHGLRERAGSACTTSS